MFLPVGGVFWWRAGVAKWTTAPVLKTGSLTGAWVRTPFPAPFSFGVGWWWLGAFFLGVKGCDG